MHLGMENWRENSLCVYVCSGMPSLNRDVNEKGDDWLIILKRGGCHGVTKYKKPSVLGLFVYRSTNVLCVCTCVRALVNVMQK